MQSSPRSPLNARRALAVLVLVVAPLVLGGCANGRGSASLEIASLGGARTILPGEFSTAIYGESEQNVASIYLTDAPLDSVLEGDLQRGQIVHIELLWTPRAGRTPVDPSAVNISIRHVIITGGQFGVYGGAGFAEPSDRVGDKTLTLSIPEATLSLLESSSDFVDRLGPAAFTGSITAVRDDRLTRRLAFATNQIVTNMVGEPMRVQSDTTPRAGGTTLRVVRAIDPVERARTR